MKGSVKRKCFCCRDFYSPDPRTVHHQRLLLQPGMPQGEKSAKSASTAAISGEPKLLPRVRKPSACQRLAHSQSRLLAQEEVFDPSTVTRSLPSASSTQ